MILKKGTYIMMRVADEQLDTVIDKVREFPITEVLDIYYHKVEKDEDLKFDKYGSEIQ